MNATKPTSKQIQAYLTVVQVIAQTIKECGPCPTGPMYAAAMNVMDLDTFNGILERLKGAKLIEVDGFSVATWIGPK